MAWCGVPACCEEGGGEEEHSKQPPSNTERPVVRDGAFLTIHTREAHLANTDSEIIARAGAAALTAVACCRVGRRSSCPPGDAPGALTSLPCGSCR